MGRVFSVVSSPCMGRALAVPLFPVKQILGGSNGQLGSIGGDDGLLKPAICLY